MTTSAYEVILHALGRSRFRVEYRNDVLISSSDQPIFDACRALLASGLRGTLRGFHAGANHPAMIIGIEKGAKLTVVETPTEGPRFGKWRPFSHISSATLQSTNGGIQDSSILIGAGVPAPDSRNRLCAGTVQLPEAVQHRNPPLCAASHPRIT